MVITADANIITFDTTTIPTRNVFRLDYDSYKIYLYHEENQLTQREPTTWVYNEITSYNGSKPPLATIIAELREYMAATAAPPRTAYFKLIPDTTTLDTINGSLIFTVPYELDFYKLVKAEAGISTVSSGAISIQIKNLTTDNYMLSVPITIDSGEKNSYTATQSVMSAFNTVSTGDEVKIITTSAGSGAKGLNVILTFRLL